MGLFVALFQAYVTDWGLLAGLVMSSVHKFIAPATANVALASNMSTTVITGGVWGEGGHVGQRRTVTIG